MGSFSLYLFLITIYLLLYADDIILKGSSKYMIQDIIIKLNFVFSLKHLCDLDYFFGIEVKQSCHGSLLLTQTKYIRDILHKTNMLESFPATTHMQSTRKLA